MNPPRGRQGVFAVLLLALASGAAAGTVLESIRLGHHAQYTRVVLDTAAPPDCALREIQGPLPRIVLLCADMLPGKRLRPPRSSGTPVEDFAIKIEKNALRLEIILRQQMQVRRSVLLPGPQSKHYRLVLDLLEPGEALPPPVKTAAEKERERRDIVIALDAGHGGEDPGAIGPGGIYEKHIVLAITQELERIFQAENGFEAVMIRQADSYVRLEVRRERARRAEADLMLSIHADAFTDSRVRGSSVYALSEKGATSAIARYLARQANRTSPGENAGSSPDELYLSRTLAETAGDDSIEDALEIGNILLKNIKKVSKLHRKKVEQAGFAVLKSAEVPSLLVETGFISNPKDARTLSDPAHQRRLARAIATGVLSYFRQYPPSGSLLAWQRKQPQAVREHVVAPGEYLLRIARQYGVSQEALRLYNRLEGTVIYPGQKLRIPVPGSR